MISIILAALLSIGAASPALARWQCISAMDVLEETAPCDDYYSDLRTAEQSLIAEHIAVVHAAVNATFA